MERSRVQLDEYGYRCSSCCHIDGFNEENLLESPPKDILTVKLLQKYNTAQCEPEDVRRLQNCRRQCVVNHVINCTRRAKHLPLTCRDIVSCFRSDHWRYCPGFYKIRLVIEYIVTCSEGEEDWEGHISCVRVCQILPNIDVMSGIENSTSFDLEGDVTVNTSSDDAGIGMERSDDLLQAKERCRALMDYLFCMDCQFSAINGFTFLTNPRERAAILEDMIILQRTIHFRSKTVPKFTLTGVLLHCNGDHLSFQSPEEYSARALFVHSENMCRNLYSKRKIFTPKLYFHSYEIYRGSFGRKKIYVTLVLTSKVIKEIQGFCDQHFEPLSIRSNPFLQLSPCLKVIRKAEPLDPSIGLYIRVIYAGNFLLNECTSSMNTTQLWNNEHRTYPALFETYGGTNLCSMLRRCQRIRAIFFSDY